MAGKKKTGALTRTIGVRLDEPIIALAERMSQWAPSARSDVTHVLRTIVTDWLLRHGDDVGAFEELSDRIHLARAQFEVGMELGAAVEKALRALDQLEAGRQDARTRGAAQRAKSKRA